MKPLAIRRRAKPFDMNHEQIAELETALSHTNIMWVDPLGMSRIVKRIGDPPNEEFPETSKCAYLDDGYVALWNADPESFYLCTQLFQLVTNKQGLMPRGE